MGTPPLQIFLVHVGLAGLLGEHSAVTPLMNSHASQSPARTSSTFPFASKSHAVRQVWALSRERALSGRRALPVP
jgi:hypothetical protein